ncbi:MAG: hypothetical protein M3Z25_14800 [Actinomycetota bacterium]|nr:hypothetical protein [Actinomycetota bacterium]
MPDRPASGKGGWALRPFAGAADLLLPLRDLFPRLPAVQRTTLEVWQILRFVARRRTASCSCWPCASGRGVRGTPTPQDAERLMAEADPVADQLSFASLANVQGWVEQFAAAGPLLDSVLDAALALALAPAVTWSAGPDGRPTPTPTPAAGGGAGTGDLAGQEPGPAGGARGHVARCHEHVDRARRDVLPQGVDCMRVYLPSVLGLCALGQGEHDPAVDQLEQAWDAGWAQGLRATNGVPFAGDLVEAHVRAGNRARAEELLDWLDERAATTGLVYPAIASARCRGLLSTDLDVASRCFQRASAAHQRVSMPFERARTLLCQAETLRRLRAVER